MTFIIKDVAENYLNNEDRGAYLVVDSGAESDITKIVIYASLNNPSGYQVYGNILLQELLRKQLNNNDISLTFTSAPLQQSVLVESESSLGPASTCSLFLMLAYVGV